MSAQGNVVINDGQGTPVAHTFNPKGSRAQPNGKVISDWRDQSSSGTSGAVGFLTITEQYTPKNGNGIEKFRYVFEIPRVGEDLAGEPVKSFVTTGVIEVWMHEQASDQELKDIAAYLKNFTALTYFNDAIVKREPAW